MYWWSLIVSFCLAGVLKQISPPPSGSICSSKRTLLIVVSSIEIQCSATCKFCGRLQASEGSNDDSDVFVRLSLMWEEVWSAATLCVLIQLYTTGWTVKTCVPIPWVLFYWSNLYKVKPMNVWCILETAWTLLVLYRLVFRFCRLLLKIVSVRKVQMQIWDRTKFSLRYVTSKSQ